eukprot:gene20174-26190_t
MGNSSSNNESKGKKVVESKLNSSLKTGILNLSNQDLKPMSSLWPRLSTVEFVAKIRVLTISNNELKLLPIDITDLEGNTELTKQLVMKWAGIETYLERKQTNRIKNSNSGAFVDQSLFGID